MTKKGGFRIPASGVGINTGDSGIWLRASGRIQRKVEGGFPLPSDPVRQAHGPELAEGLSLGGARKTKKKGYHRPQASSRKATGR